MKLSDLDPQFVRVKEPGKIHEYVDSITEAQGVQFLCPKCFAAKGSAIGVHGVLCWSPVVGPDEPPGPGRWNLVGTGYHDLSLQAGSSSVLLTGGCCAHFFVENGEIRMC